MNTTEVNGRSTKSMKPVARLNALTSTIQAEYNAIIESLRPGEMDPEELQQTTDAMMDLANAASCSVASMMLHEFRNHMSQNRRLPDVVHTYRVRGDNETHCIFDYANSKQWDSFVAKHGSDIHDLNGSEFEPTQRYRFSYRSREGLPTPRTMEGTFEEFVAMSRGRMVITDAIVI